MPEKQDTGTASIISIIREMVRAGEPEEKIIKSLKELGIKEKDAKKLLLIGEADTFSLLQNEINKMVKEYFEKEKPQLKNYIKEEAEKAEQEMVEKVEKRALNAFKEDQRFIENQATMFQSRINQSVKNILQLNQEIKSNIADLASRVSNNEREVWSLKDLVFGSRGVRYISYGLVALEVGLVGATAYLFYTKAQGMNFGTMVSVAAIGVTLATIVMIIRLKV
jgi:carboxylesterase type B